MRAVVQTSPAAVVSSGWRTPPTSDSATKEPYVSSACWWPRCTQLNPFAASDVPSASELHIDQASATSRGGQLREGR